MNFVVLDNIVKGIHFVFEISIFFLILFVLFIFFSKVYREVQLEEGIYKNKTFLPSFMGNSVMLTLNRNQDKIKIFFGNSESRMIVKENNLNIKIDINLKRISNYDIHWYRYIPIRDNIIKNGVLSIHISNNKSDSKVFFNDNIYRFYCDLRLRSYELMGKKFVRIVANLYSINKGVLDYEKKIYIENIKLRLNLLKTPNE